MKAKNPKYDDVLDGKFYLYDSDDPIGGGKKFELCLCVSTWDGIAKRHTMAFMKRSNVFLDDQEGPP